MRRRLLIVAVVALLAGCGGGDGDPPDTPKGTVEGFLTAVDNDDWNTACDHAYHAGNLGSRLRVDQTEADDFGIIKDCAATFEKHSDALKAVLEGTEPDTVTDERPDSAVVTSSKGNWGVVVERDRWLVELVP